MASQDVIPAYEDTLLTESRRAFCIRHQPNREDLKKGIHVKLYDLSTKTWTRIQLTSNWLRRFEGTWFNYRRVLPTQG